MKKWILKALLQKAISYMPGSARINYFFQKYVTKGVLLSEEYFIDRLQHAQEHLQAYKKYGSSKVPQNALELGTGWYPTVPIAFFLVGTEKIYSLDIKMHTNVDRVHRTIEKFIKLKNENKLRDYIDYQDEKFAILEDIYAHPEYSLNKILNYLKLHYLIEDARSLSLEDNSIELINSNNTFEHIYPNILHGILQEFKRVVNKDGGIMSHFIDMSDHFAHFDPSITIYNFLSFSPKQWKLIDNSIQPQNRLRFSDYLELYQESGIPITEFDVREGDKWELQKVKLDQSYADYDPKDLAISHCQIISKFD